MFCMSINKNLKTPDTELKCCCCSTTTLEDEVNVLRIITEEEEKETSFALCKKCRISLRNFLT